MDLIVCYDENRGIGYRGDLLYHIRDDMKRFRELTKDATVIMGRATMDSLPQKKLPGRKNVVITKSNLTSGDPEVFVVHSEDEAFQCVQGDSKVFIIGGQIIYETFAPYCHKAYITLVHAGDKPHDREFPDLLATGNWRQTVESAVYLDQRFWDNENGVEFSFIDLINQDPKEWKAKE